MAAPEIYLLVDGLCPLCKREAAFLERRDKGRGRLVTIDITAPGFDPARYERSMDDLMGQIHGVLPDGTILTGMAVFRRAYQAVGLGWLLAPTGWPVLRPLGDAAYRWFARNRTRLTGRCEGGRCGVGGGVAQAGDSSATR